MPKKRKLQLGSLRVRSFVTELGKDAGKVKGGETANTQCIAGSCLECSEGVCLTDWPSCVDTVCGSYCVGTCAGSNCVGTCVTACGTCDTCGACNITVPSCPQIIC